MHKSNKYLLIAFLLGLVFHGSAIFFTLESTYDALIHLFFGKHYSVSWFEPWNYQWYTGFTVTSYPPLVHQLIALFSYIGGLKFGLFSVAIIAVVLFIFGVYRFSKLLTNSREMAGYAAILAVFSSSFVETLHLFGQLPSIFGISLLMISLPNIYSWIRHGSRRDFIICLSLLSITVTSHHVTPIFGMVFFIFPIIGMAIMETSKARLGSYKAIRLTNFIYDLRKLLPRIIGFGISTLVLIIFCILPYWINTKNNPITQVPIPHGSRDNFIEITSSGLVFFLIPWGFLLFLLPYFFYRYFSKKYLFFGISLSILALLGTGGTTPIPRMLLGEAAFNILTLDRFTLWASILVLPLFGEFTYRFAEGDIKAYLQKKYSENAHRVLGGLMVGCFLFMSVFTITLGYFRPAQPEPIKMLPIVNFLSQDEHDKWRYLTLGFGDQMSWLSAQTSALTVDGNYHSARRLPELTTRAVERLENSKFKGIEGLGSLQQFLTVPEKYNLKFIFSNDKFYDPLLFYCGWQRLSLLENGIMVWEKPGVPPILNVLPKDRIPSWQKIMWGLIPLSTVVVLALILLLNLSIPRKKEDHDTEYSNQLQPLKNRLYRIHYFWGTALVLIICFGIYQLYLTVVPQKNPDQAVVAYYDALDFKEYEKAYSMIDPNSNLSLAQFMLEGSVRDGLINSYAKLNSISTTEIEFSADEAKLKVNLEWITPLEVFNEQKVERLVKRGGKWYLIPHPKDEDIPADQFLSKSQADFYNQGRRRVSIEKTYHEDVLKQPDVRVLSASLVKTDSAYSVIGTIQNVDNYPADVVVKSNLYDRENKVLASFNCKFLMKHKLLPLEITPFKIDFENVAWVKPEESVPSSFDPNQFTPLELESIPVNFDVHLATNISSKEKYAAVQISDLSVDNSTINGELFNGGLKEVTIPQILISYYNEDRKLIWVGHSFIDEGIRQHRKRKFSLNAEIPQNVEILREDLTNCFVNGMPNSTIDGKLKNINPDIRESLQKMDSGNFSYINLYTNCYIGKW